METEAEKNRYRYPESFKLKALSDFFESGNLKATATSLGIQPATLKDWVSEAEAGGDPMSHLFDMQRRVLISRLYQIINAATDKLESKLEDNVSVQQLVTVAGIATDKLHMLVGAKSAPRKPAKPKGSKHLGL